VEYHQSIESVHVATPRGATVAALAALAGIGVAAAWDPLIAAVATLTALIAAPLLLHVVSRRPIEPLEALWPFLVCYGVTFALKPFLLMAGFVTYAWTNIDRAAATEGVLWAVGGLAFFYVGHYALRPRRPAEWINEAFQERSPASIRVSAALLTFGAVYAIYTVARLSGISPTPQEVFSERFRSASFEVFYGRGWLIMLLSCSVFGPAAQAYVAFTTRRTLDAILGAVLLVIVTGAVFCFYSRALLLQVFIALIVVLHYKGGWFRGRSLAIMGGVLLILAGGLGLRRVQDQAAYEGLASPLAAVAFLGSTFDSFEFLVPAVQRMSLFGELTGQSLIEDIAWTFVPRALVPNKPDTYGFLLVQNAIMADLASEGPQTGTFPAGFLAEWYVNFGVCGFIFISLLYGAVLRLGAAVVQRPAPRLIPLLFYGCVLLNMVGLMRGSGQMIVQAMLYSVLLVALFGRWPAIRRLRRRAGDSGAVVVA
jgi:hypothetical protein